MSSSLSMKGCKILMNENEALRGKNIRKTFPRVFLRSVNGVDKQASDSDVILRRKNLRRRTRSKRHMSL